MENESDQNLDLLGNLPIELQSIKKFASWKGYARNIVNAIMKRVLSKETLTNNIISNDEKEKTPAFFINRNYPEENGGHLLKKCLKELGQSANQEVNLVCRCSITNISFFTNMRDKLNKLSKANAGYQFSCPGCESSYIGKTE